MENPQSNGSRAASSMPYMCCEGTVATIQGWPAPGGSTRRMAAAFNAAVARREDQLLRCAVGPPVLPEVWPIRATKSCDGATRDAAPREGANREPIVWSSMIEQAPYAAAVSATIAAALDGGSKVVFRPASAAAKPARNAYRLAQRLMTWSLSSASDDAVARKSATPRMSSPSETNGAVASRVSGNCVGCW